MKVSNVFSSANQWLIETPERALDRAYQSALKIKEIEDNYFQGRTVSPDNAEYSARVIGYFQAEVKNCLQNIKVRIIEFNFSRNIVNLASPSRKRYRRGGDIVVFSDTQSSLVVEKLEFIESITGKYLSPQGRKNLSSYYNTSVAPENIEKTMKDPNHRRLEGINPSTENVIPRSFFSSFSRLKQEVSPESKQSEEDILRQFRESRYQTNLSIRFILILIIVPLFTYQISKTYLVMPALNHYFEQKEKIVFLNDDLQSEAMQELKEYREMMEFEALLGKREPVKAEEQEKLLKEKVDEISRDYQKKSLGAIANIFADTLAFLSVVFLLLSNRRELQIVKDFLNRIFYNLSDSAKAFILILSTDMFVGFHSPHGWEVIIDGFLRHFGLPENQNFSNLFIATFPVILDTVFKYWIFRYLNGLSPSSVATYKNMNE